MTLSMGMLDLVVDVITCDAVTLEGGVPPTGQCLLPSASFSPPGAVPACGVPVAQVPALPSPLSEQHNHCV